MMGNSIFRNVQMAWKPEDIIGRASAGFDQADISEFAKLLMGNSMFRNASAGFEKANAGFDQARRRGIHQNAGGYISVPQGNR